MSIFSKPEVVVLKESSDARDYLQKLQDLLPKATGDVKTKIEKEIAVVNAGIIGEDNIMFELKNSGMNLVVIHDLYLKTKSGLTAQIDYFVVAPKCFYIIECKNLFGNIEINSKGDFIRTFQYGKHTFKEGLYSPITQNERHMTVLKEIRTENQNALVGFLKNSTFDSFFKSVVVLANPKTVVNDKYAKKEVKQKVIRADQLINFIKETEMQSKELSCSIKEMRKYAEGYLRNDQEERPDYFEKYEELVKELNSDESTIAEPDASEVSNIEVTSVEERRTEETITEKITQPELPEDMICPRCGNKLVLRTAKKGENAGNQFYGCSSFPKCRFVKNL